MYKQLKQSVLSNDIPLFLVLIDNVNINSMKKSICHLVIHKRRVEMLKILMNKNIDRCIINEHGETVFHICCKKNWIQMAKIILYRDGKEQKSSLSFESKKLLTLKNKVGETVFDFPLKNNVFQWLQKIKVYMHCEYCALENGYNCDEHLCIMCFSILSVCTLCNKNL
jgi:hypothetical protein